MTYITTNTWANHGKKSPSAHLTVQKNRIKKYDSNFYLKDGQEFEIELYNPTTSEVLAVIKLNGESIGPGGIVLRPGERVWLERFLDNSRKFKFSTYTVSGSAETREAIANNGDLNVQFYNKKTPNFYFSNAGGSFTVNNSGGSYTANANLTANCDYTTTYNTGTKLTGMGWTDANFSTFSQPVAGSLSSLYSADVKTIETGRVENGSASSQVFSTTDMQFEAYPFHILGYKILPISNKPTYSKDLKIAKYCTECGSRTKDSWKFCATCGNKI